MQITDTQDSTGEEAGIGKALQQVEEAPALFLDAIDRAESVGGTHETLFSGEQGQGRLQAPKSSLILDNIGVRKAPSTAVPEGVRSGNVVSGSFSGRETGFSGLLRDSSGIS